MIQDLQNLDWGYYGPELFTAIGDTLYMVGWAFLLGGVLGLLVGMILYTTRPGGIFANRAAYLAINFVVNLIRPIPFVILIAALQPLTIQVVGSGIGNTAVVFCMIWASTFGIARIVEQNLVSLDPGVIEAARAMGASRMRIIRTVVLPEALGPLILGFTFVIISLVDMSAMAGIIGGGGLGKIAINYGYYNFKYLVMWAAVIGLILLVQIFQSGGTWLGNKCDKRLKNRS